MGLMGLVGLGVAEGQSLFFGLDYDRSLPVYAAAQQGLAEVVEQQSLDGTLDGSCTEVGVVALLGQQFHCRVLHLQGDAVLLEHLPDTVELQPYHLLDLAVGEGVEDDGLVYSVQELGPDGLLQQVEHLLAGALEVLGRLGILEELAAQVTGHDDDGVLEVDSASLRVGETSVVEHLQQGVEDIGVGLLYLIEEDYLVGLSPDGLCELSALVVADVSWRGSDQTRHAELLLVLAHVDSGHHRLVVEEVVGQRLGQLGLTDTGGTQEDE